MTPYVATNVRIEEIAADALQQIFLSTPALVGIFKPVAGDSDVQGKLPKLGTTVTSMGEHPSNTGVHKLNYVVKFDANPTDTTSQTIRDMWAAVVGVVYQSNLKSLLSQTAPFSCYGVIRKPHIQTVEGEGFHKMISFTAFGIELTP